MLQLKNIGVVMNFVMQPASCVTFEVKVKIGDTNFTIYAVLLSQLDSLEMKEIPKMLLILKQTICLKLCYNKSYFK